MQFVLFLLFGLFLLYWFCRYRHLLLEVVMPFSYAFRMVAIGQINIGKAALGYIDVEGEYILAFLP